MDTIVDISVLPIKVLVHIFEFVPNKENLFLVSKKFYHAACIASQSDYCLSLHGNSEIRSNFDNMIESKRFFDDFGIDNLNLQTFSENDIEMFLAILKKFGANVKYLSITYKLITEHDVHHILSFFPNIQTFVIDRDYSEDHSEKIRSVPIDIFKFGNQLLRLASLESIHFDSKTLQLNKIFEKIELSEHFKTIYANVRDPSSCFTFLKMNSSIENLSLTSSQCAVSIPINHLILKSLTLHLPKSIQLLPFLEQQTYLDSLDFFSYGEEIPDSSDDDNDLENSDDFESPYSHTLDSNILHSFEGLEDSESSEDSEGSEVSESSNNLEKSEFLKNSDANVDLLKSVAKMIHLTKLNVCIDQISNDDFVNFPKLSSLKQLCIRSTEIKKIRLFSTISVPNVTRLLLYFQYERVPSRILINIAKNFPNVINLIYEGNNFCDGFFCFAGNLPALENFTVMTCDYFETCRRHFVPSKDTETKVVCLLLKTIYLNFSFPDQQNVHKFMIRLALAVPNLESLWLEVESMKFVPNGFIYILRNFKKLKNIKISYDLSENDGSWRHTGLVLNSMSNVKYFARINELEIINILKEHGTKLEFIEMSLSSKNDLEEDLWRQSFHQQFSSIKADHKTIVMKKDEKFNEWNAFA